MEYELSRALNQVEQILNYSYNWYEDYIMIEEFLSIFKNILSKSSSPEFENSIDNSINCLNNPDNLYENIKSLENNQSHSFLVIHLNLVNHLLLSIVRKNDNNFSVVILNRNSKEKERSFFEYLIDKNNLSNLVEIYSKADYDWENDKLQGAFKKISSNYYKLNIENKTKIFQNSFLKEFEEAIKFAYGTRNFSKASFEELRKDANNNLTKFDFGKFTRTEIYKLYVEQMKIVYPEINKELAELFNLYNNNNKFRNYLRSGINVIDSLKRAFYEINLFEKEQKIINIVELIKNIDYCTFKENISDIKVLINKINDENINRCYNVLVKNSLLLSLMGNCNEDEICDIEVVMLFPMVVKQMYEENGFSYVCESKHLAQDGNFRKAITLSERAINLLPAFPGIYMSYADIHKLNKNFNKALDNYSKAIDLSPNCGLSYYKRSETYLINSEIEKASKDYEIAVINYPRFKNSKLHENLQKKLTF